MEHEPSKTYLACVGDANHPDTWSSIPYHLVLYGRAAGFIDAGLPLNPHTARLRATRLAWGVLRLLTGGGRGGFQYSLTMLNRLWRDVQPTLRGSRVINQFNFFPPSMVKDSAVEKWFYVDGTLTLLNRYYGARIGRRIFADAIKREREGYESAAQIVTFSRFAADSIVRDYGIPASRVAVVVPGANIAPDAYEQWEKQAIARRSLREEPGAGQLRLAFVGRGAVRKGLDRLLRAMLLAQGRGFQGSLRIIGADRDEVEADLANTPNVEWIGTISRRSEPQRLLETIAECDVGVLLSRVDYSPIALREYLALGMVVIGPDTGGCADLMAPEASVAIKPEDPAELIADVLLGLERDRDRFARMRAHAWAVRRTALWTESIRQLQSLAAR